MEIRKKGLENNTTEEKRRVQKEKEEGIRPKRKEKETIRNQTRKKEKKIRKESKFCFLFGGFLLFSTFFLFLFESFISIITYSQRLQ